MSGELLLCLDTSTRRAAIALGDGVETPRAERSWVVGYHHSAELLTTLDALLGEVGATLVDVAAVVVGTGPGSFTGLRVGLATAKALAYGLHRPIVGVASTAALAFAAAQAAGLPSSTTELAIVLPAGPSDRYLARYRLRPTGVVLAADVPTAGSAPEPLEPLEPPRLVGRLEQLAPLLVGSAPVAIDLDGTDLTDEAARVGALAQRGLGGALLALGRLHIATGAVSDLAALVPEYVTLPRGIREQSGEISWSRDLR